MPPNDNSPKVNQIQIKVDGANLPNSTMDKLLDVEVETSLYLPSMFTLRFSDEDLSLIDADTMSAGKAVEILMGEITQNTVVFTSIFKGEVTAIEPEFTDGFMGIMVVRGYDKGHRLNSGTKSRVFVQSTDSDIVRKIAQEAGLSATTDATTEVFEHVFQYAVNDWAFIHERARRNNFEVSVDDGKLYFRKATTAPAAVTLTWGTTMQRFQPRMSLTKQTSTVKVRGWDPKKKASILGQASTSSSSPTTGFDSWGGPLSKKAFGNIPDVLEVHHPVHSQKEADTMAQAILDEINAGFLEAEGVAYGNPDLKAGIKVKIEKVGTKFSGTYFVTTARHIYNAEGYDTHFTVQGTRAKTISDLMDQSISDQRTGQLWGGIVPALVTNNNDPEGTARVKVKFPWLDDQLESGWVPVASVAAGNQTGILWLPEVNDEVLVAFEHGDFDYPYVVGAVWNGKDAPPEATSTAVSGGKVVVRTFKTTAGNIIRLTDTSGSEKIEIITAKTKTQLTMDDANMKITLESKGDILLKATGNLTLEGVNVKVTASGNLEAKATGTGTVQSTGPMAVKGAVVNIN